MANFDDLPLFRNTDPEGSVNGAKHITPKRGSQAYSLLIAYMGSPVYGLTDEEACTIRGIHHGWKRCADLRRLGLIEPTGDYRPTMAGVNAMVCRITDAGWEAVK